MNQLRVRFQMTLELSLAEIGIIEAAEFDSQAAQHPDQLELPDEPVDGKVNVRPAREADAGLGLPLHLGERIAAGKKMRHEVVAAEARIVEVAVLLRRVERPPQQRPPCPDMPRPAAEAEIDARFEAVQSVSFDQVKAELGEAVARLVIVKVRPKYGAEQDIGEARRMGVAELQA